MSYEQLETRFKALQKQLTDTQTEHAKVTGARTELDFMQSQMVPGIDHEMLDKRKTEMDQILGKLSQQVIKLTGQIGEVAYWMHLTPDGQRPSEAIAQLQMTDEQRQGYPFASEGPRTDAEAVMLRPDPAARANGYVRPDHAAELVAAGAV